MRWMIGTPGWLDDWNDWMIGHIGTPSLGFPKCVLSFEELRTSYCGPEQSSFPITCLGPHQILPQARFDPWAGIRRSMFKTKSPIHHYSLCSKEVASIWCPRHPARCWVLTSKGVLRAVTLLVWWFYSDLPQWSLVGQVCMAPMKVDQAQEEALPLCAMLRRKSMHSSFMTPSEFLKWTIKMHGITVCNNSRQHTGWDFPCLWGRWTWLDAFKINVPFPSGTAFNDVWDDIFRRVMVETEESCSKAVLCH